MVALEEVEELVLRPPLHRVEVPRGLGRSRALLERGLCPGRRRSEQQSRQDGSLGESSHGSLSFERTNHRAKYLRVRRRRLPQGGPHRGTLRAQAPYRAGTTFRRPALDGNMSQPQDRRTFLEQVGVASAAIIGGASLPPRPAMAATTGEGWDMSWLNALKPASYRAVIDANTLEEGYAADLASGLLSNFQEVHGASGDQIRIVIVARRGGTPLVLGDALWNSFRISEEVKVSDSDNTPYRRNPYYRPRPGAPAGRSASKLETLQQRGVILLVCNIAATNWSHRLAEMAKRDVEEVKKEVYANFVPGTIVVPSGVFGLMRAQNAGCAYMRGQ